MLSRARFALYQTGTVSALLFTTTILIFAIVQPYALFTWHPICMSLYFSSAIYSVQILANSGAKGYTTVVVAEREDALENSNNETAEPRQSRESISDLLGARVDGSRLSAEHHIQAPATTVVPGLATTYAKEWLPFPLPFIPRLSHLQRRSRLWLHLIFHFTAFLLALTGLAVIVANKIINGRAHFQTYHGIFGIITIILFSGQVVFGYLAQNDGAFGEYFRRNHGAAAFANFRKLHRINGVMVVIPLLCTVAGLAVYEAWVIEVLDRGLGSLTPVVQGLLVGLVGLSWVGIFVQGALR